jgi:hypothetical protein
MTTYRDANTVSQQANRNQLKNTVFAWAFVKAFLSMAKSLPTPVESIYNAFVRLFVNDAISTPEPGINAILPGYPSKTYGYGIPVRIVAAVPGATGVTVSYAFQEGISNPTDMLRVMLYNKTTGAIQIASQVFGAEDLSTILLPSEDILAGDVGFLAAYTTNELDTESTPIVVFTDLV